MQPVPFHIAEFERNEAFIRHHSHTHIHTAIQFRKIHLYINIPLCCGVKVMSSEWRFAQIYLQYEIYSWYICRVGGTNNIKLWYLKLPALNTHWHSSSRPIYIDHIELGTDRRARRNYNLYICAYTPADTQRTFICTFSICGHHSNPTKKKKLTAIAHFPLGHCTIWTLQAH